MQRGLFGQQHRVVGVHLQSQVNGLQSVVRLTLAAQHTDEVLPGGHLRHTVLHDDQLLQQFLGVHPVLLHLGHQCADGQDFFVFGVEAQTGIAQGAGRGHFVLSDEFGNRLTDFRRGKPGDFPVGQHAAQSGFVQQGLAQMVHC